MEKTKYSGNYAAGVDEAGRGPWAGPVFAAAVILDPNQPIIEGLKDSKKLSHKQREKLFYLIQEKSLAWSVGRAEVAEIDKINILQASLLAMQRAVNGLSIVPEFALVDGNTAPLLACPIQLVIRGDQTIPAISAASILAKVARDAEMCCLDKQFPGYGFSQHKGYGTAAHAAALEKNGPSIIHRRSFAPIAKYYIS